MSDSIKTLKILNRNIEIQFKSGANLLELLNAHDIGIFQSCGGNGTCTTCRVVVQNNNAVLPRNELEIERAVERGFATNERLSCQTELLDDVEIEIPEDPT